MNTPAHTGPLFSIILPTYNRAGYLPASIDSVLKQHWQNWELIVVDDGSTDNTREVMSAYKDPRIKYHYQTNRERSAARNKGIDLAKGNYICFLDSDDYYLPEHLEVLSDAVTDAPPTLFLTGSYIETGGKRQIHPPLQSTEKAMAVREAMFSMIIPNSVCVHTSILKEERFKEEMTIWEDMNLWLRIMIKFPFRQLDAITVVISNHENRSTIDFFNNLNIDRLRQYIRNVEDLRQHSDILKYLPGRLIDKYITNKITAMAGMCAMKGNLKKFLVCSSMLLRYAPGFYFSSSFLKMNRELLVQQLIRFRNAATA